MMTSRRGTAGRGLVWQGKVRHGSQWLKEQQMARKAPTPDRPAVTRANMGLARAATKIYRRHPAFRRSNDVLDESGTPSPSQALIAERCAIVREAYEQAARERWAKQLAKEREESEEEDGF